MQDPTIKDDYVKRVFDAAVAMTPGSRIPIQFTNAAQRDSFRVRFHNERRKFARKFGDLEADTITASKHTTPSGFFLIIEKAAPMSVPYVLTPDGSTEIIDLTCPEPQEPTLPPCIPASDFGSGTETEEQRRLRLMRQEGVQE